MKSVFNIVALILFQHCSFGQSIVLFDTADCHKKVQFSYSKQFVIHVNDDLSRSEFLNKKRIYHKGNLSELLIYDASGAIQIAYKYLYNKSGNITTVKKSNFIGDTSIYVLENSYDIYGSLKTIKVLDYVSKQEIYSEHFVYRGNTTIKYWFSEDQFDGMIEVFSNRQRKDSIERYYDRDTSLLYSKIYKYNFKGDLLSIIEIDAKDKSIKAQEVEYDNSGREGKRLFFDGSKIEFVLFTNYFKNRMTIENKNGIGDLLEKKIFYLSNKSIGSIIYSYNKEVDQKKEIKYFYNNKGLIDKVIESGNGNVNKIIVYKYSQ